MKSHHFLPFLPLTHAALPGTRVYGDFVSDVEDSVWLDAFSRPNATGSVNITGWNITDPYPGAQTNDWRYTISVVADVPWIDPKKFSAATWIALEPPSNLFRNVGNGSKILDQDPSWNTCQFVWHSDKVSAQEEVDGDTCKGGLDLECYHAWERKLSLRKLENDGCADFGPPPECNANLGIGEKGGRYQGYGLGPMVINNTQYADKTDGKISFVQDALPRESHEAGNTTAYDVLSRRVYIIGHVWGASINASTPGGPRGATTIELKCLRANLPRSSSSGALLPISRGAVVFFALVAGLVSTL